ncbi:hypothetical protein D1007_58301 [Hordeum vulgare]|nr:hypothetical protein D1007_58301 [Hordeum vulgare]
MGCGGSEEAIRPPSCPASTPSSSMRSERKSSYPSSSLSSSPGNRQPLRGLVARSHGRRFFLEKALGAEGVVAGAWLGSEVGEEHNEALRHHRLLPPTSQVLVRLPGAETAPTPAVGEVMVFTEHFYRGFGLPANAFFSEWLRFFVLQLHYLAPNAILQLSAFVILCEGFVRIEPRVDLWRSLFFFKQQSIAMEKSDVEKIRGCAR